MSNESRAESIRKPLQACWIATRLPKWQDERKRSRALRKQPPSSTSRSSGQTHLAERGGITTVILPKNLVVFALCVTFISTQPQIRVTLFRICEMGAIADSVIHDVKRGMVSPPVVMTGTKTLTTEWQVTAHQRLCCCLMRHVQMVKISGIIR